MRNWAKWMMAGVVGVGAQTALAGSADPQVMTDHPWYPGELSCSTFPRLFNTQARLYERVTGRKADTDEDKALASWYWRNLNYFHGEEGKCDVFGQGFTKADTTREYWAGLFANGFALCGTTHAQWNAEMDALLGHGRSRSVGVAGHNSFEVFLTGGAYGAGRWALLDHDISTVIFSPDGKRLMGLDEIQPQAKAVSSPQFKPERQRGWRVSGLHDQDAAGVYTKYTTAEYLAGYAGPPPMVHLRAGETLRRYLNPGLEDGKTFVFWGRNAKSDIPGPARDRTWVNQPEKMYGSTRGTGAGGQRARYANAVFTYQPRFADGTYKEAVVAEDEQRVAFGFRSPYLVACTPANDKPWGIYDAGGTNGLVITGKADVEVSISVDAGKTWQSAGKLAAGKPVDATDLVKGQFQYQIAFSPAAAAKADDSLTIRAVCQSNATTIPHLKDGTNTVTFEQSGRAIASVGPTLPVAQAHVVDGKFGSPSVTLEVAPPAGAKAVHVYAAAWQASGSPPDAKVKYQIEWSADGGKSWKPVVKDWQVVRQGVEPKDFWSQSFTWGDVALPEASGPMRVRFKNNGGKQYRKAEVHLAYADPAPSPTTVTFAWREAGGATKTASKTYPAGAFGKQDSSWTFDAGKKVETQWVEYAAK